MTPSVGVAQFQMCQLSPGSNFNWKQAIPLQPILFKTGADKQELVGLVGMEGERATERYVEKAIFRSNLVELSYINEHQGFVPKSDLLVKIFLSTANQARNLNTLITVLGARLRTVWASQRCRSWSTILVLLKRNPLLGHLASVLDNKFPGQDRIFSLPLVLTRNFLTVKRRLGAVLTHLWCCEELMYIVQCVGRSGAIRCSAVEWGEF